MSSLGVGDSVLLGVVRKQRGRLIASIMGAIEEELPDLDGEVRDRLRSRVVQSATVFSDFSIDSLKSSREQSDHVNDEVLQVLSRYRRG